MTHPTDLLPLPEQLWLMYAKKKPSLRRVSITNDLSAEEKSSGWVAEPYARANIAAMAGEPSPAAAPALVPLDARRIAKLAFEMCSACYSGMDHQFAGMTIVKFAQAVQADFCRINGLTVGDGGV